jgi:deoxycytidine triphosphate deaminase
MILDRQAILEALADGRIVYDYARDNPEMIQGGSIDFAVGDQIWTPNSSHGTGALDPYSAAEPQWKLPQKIGDAVTLYSGHHYLMRSAHPMGTAPGSGIIAECRAKSTAGRWGLTVALCAGYGDEGYTGHWALEVRPAHTIRLRPWSVIGQLVFHQTTGRSSGENYAAKPGAYQDLSGAVRILPKPLKVLSR